MKILQLVTRRQHRGAEVAAATVSREFIRAGHSVILAGLYSPPKLPLTVDGAVSIDIDAKPGFFSVHGLRQLLRVVDHEQPDILHANGSDTLKYLVVIKWMRPKAVVLYRNISLISHWLGSSLLKRAFYSFLFRSVDYVTSVGDASREDFMRTFKFSPDRIQVVRRGIRIPEMARKGGETAMNSLLVPPEKDIILHVGKFSAEKNHDLLLESFSILVKSSASALLILVGDGELLHTMKSKAKSLGIADRVRFEGLKQDLDPYFLAAKIIVLTSYIEGVPGVLMEAAAYGVPAVAVNVGGVSEAVDHNVTGLLLNDHSPGSFAAAMLELMKNEQVRSRLGAEAARVVKEKFDIRRCANQFVSIFESVQRSKKDVG